MLDIAYKIGAYKAEQEITEMLTKVSAVTPAPGLMSRLGKAGKMGLVLGGLGLATGGLLAAGNPLANRPAPIKGLDPAESMFSGLAIGGGAGLGLGLGGLGGGGIKRRLLGGIIGGLAGSKVNNPYSKPSYYPYG